MSFEYIEINDRDYIPDCVEVHKEIFHLSDSEAFPSFFFNMVIRKEHPLGIIIGCFKNENNKTKLIGLFVSVYDLIDKSLYCVLVGVLSKYQNGRHGYMFSQKLREVASGRGLNKLYGIYDPLEANLGKLYSFVGGITTKYIKESIYSEYPEDVVDKVLFEWQFNNDDGKNYSNKPNFNQLEYHPDKYKTITTIETNEPEFLIEIPSNYNQLKSIYPEKAEQWRMITREMLTHYLNIKKYIITDCFSRRIDGQKKTFYLLSNKYENA